MIQQNVNKYHHFVIIVIYLFIGSINIDLVDVEYLLSFGHIKKSKVLFLFLLLCKINIWPSFCNTHNQSMFMIEHEYQLPFIIY